jgi:hypothetical protein
VPQKLCVFFLFPRLSKPNQKTTFSGSSASILVAAVRRSGCTLKGEPMLSLISKRTTGEPMPAMPLHIPLASAYLCQDCNCVSNCSRRCPACASEVLMGLAGILNREVVEEVSRQNYSYVTAMVA